MHRPVAGDGVSAPEPTGQAQAAGPAEYLAPVYMVHEVRALPRQPFSIPDGWFLVDVLGSTFYDGGTSIRLLLEEM